jgi:transposase
MAGRATKLTPETQERIVEALRAGNYQDAAAAYAGISDSTFHNWLNRGKEEAQRISDGEKANPKEAIYLEFFAAVEKARSEAEVRNVMHIQRAAQNGTWQAAAWFLERSYPRRWGRKDRHEHVGENGEPIRVNVSTSDLEEKIRKLKSETPGEATD